VNTKESVATSPCADQLRRAEHELRAFVSAVTRLFGPEQARPAAEDWLDEAEAVEKLPRSASRHWRTITVAASARLASRITAPRQDRTPLGAATDTNVSPIPSSDCFSSSLLA